MRSTTRFVRDRLAAIAAGIRADMLAPEVMRETARIILDTLGCAIGAVSGTPCLQVRRVANELGGREESSVIGQSARSSCTLAALVNGTLLRFLDGNDYYFGRDPAHASGNLAAALAVAERESASGLDLIAALVTGYEIQLRLCDSAGAPSLWDRGWHHATNMQFAAAALSAQLLGLDRDGIANALAIAGTHNNTLTESMRGDMATIKASIEATTAKAGIEAALFAQAGMTGPPAIFEGTFGWINTVAGTADIDRLTRPLDGRFKIMDTCMKPFAAHALSQGVIQAAIDVARVHRIDASRVAAVELRYPAPVLALPSMDAAKLTPRNKETADHSPPYLAAMGLLFGECGPAQFTPHCLDSPEAWRLIERTRICADAALNAAWPHAMAGGIRVTLQDGTVHESLCRYPPGHPQNRLDDAALERKFREYTKGVLDSRQAEAIIGAVRTLDACRDLNEFTSLLRVAWR